MTLKKKIAILALTAFLTYLPSFGNKFVWDDEQFIYKNQYVLNFDIQKIFTTNTIEGAGHNSNYYRPLTTLSFAIDHQIWGLNEFGFHLTNTFLHIGAGLLLFFYLRSIKLNEKTAFWISLFFLIHPLQTEAVTYINSRGDSLYAFFTMLGLLTFSLSFKKKFKKIQIYNLEIKASKFTFIALSISCYIFAVLSKEIALATIGLFALTLLKKFIDELTVDNLQEKNKFFSLIKTYRSQIINIISIIACAALYLYLKATKLNFLNSFNFYDGKNIYSSNLMVRLITFSKIFFTYLRLLIFPYPLHMERDSEIITQFFSPWPIAFTLFLIIIIIFALLEIKSVIKRKQSEYKAWFYFGAIWFATMLVPVSGIIPINGLIYEHWLYLPMIGFFICLYAVFKLFTKNFSQLFKKIEKQGEGSESRSERGYPGVNVKYFLYILCAIYIILTIRQNYLWANPIRFYEYTLNYAHTARLHNNLGMAYAEAGQFNKAIEQYEKSLEIVNIYPEIFHNLANVYKSIGETDQAIKYYEQAIELDPGFHFSYGFLVELYLKKADKVEAESTLEQKEKAVQLLEKYLQIYPNNDSVKAMIEQIQSE